MVHYEFPLSEGMRTWLRLEALLGRLDELVARDAPVDHHGALATTFEIADIAARVDLKGDLLRDLERHRSALLPLRDHPAVDRATLDRTLVRLAAAQEPLGAAVGKLGAQLASNEFLVSVKSRISIPAGTCEFDLPAYHAWKQKPADLRRVDLSMWLQPLMPYAQALRLVLELVRASGERRREVARGGTWQQTLGAGRPVTLVRLRVLVEDPLAHVPEVSGHRLQLAIRMLGLGADGHLRPCGDDVAFDLTLCSAP